ncbi:MAG: type 4a pilus biogenesis protein PilO [Candidatus Rokubacteria bacterium]|nr:type 4a pilus biogenesis protein PilO [Candidatus Rokubacteria bacterium]MBI3824454.1 type 4a pilus biogenesis protein PilO [Candidatus Rokubacteria bacterium]
MIGSFSSRERVVVAGGLVAAVLIGGVVTVDRIRERYRTAAELTPVREQVLAQRQELVARRGAFASELEATNARIKAVSGRLLTAATPPVAASELQKLAKDMAAQASTEIRSERILPPVERGELLEIPVEIAVAGEIRQLVDLLARIERTPKLLTVQDLKVRVVNVTQPKELLVTLTVSGFILPEKPKT